MALFTLTDIKIKGESLKQTTSTIVPSKYLYNTLRYPVDIGNNDKGHYMVIHINEQTKTQFPGNQVSSDQPTIFENRVRTGVVPGPVFATTKIASVASDLFRSQTFEKFEDFSKSLVDKLSSSSSGVSDSLVKNFLNGVKGFYGGSKEFFLSSLDQLKEGKFVRTIRRTTDTVALYMPDTLNFVYDQSYSQAEFAGSPLSYLGALSDAFSKIPGASKMDSREIGEKIGQNLSPFIFSELARLGGNAGLAVFAAGTGTVVNPQLELIYSSPKFRSFRFDFMFYPRSYNESLEVQGILERLKYHQAPEVLGQNSPGGLGSFFLVPPSEFDIKFYYNGKINPNIPQISTCVLTNIDIDYAPNGFSSYEVPGQNTPKIAGTGMPVAIRMSLQFQETEILTKANFRTARSDYVEGGVSY
jgi:hypothetical protein